TDDGPRRNAANDWFAAGASGEGVGLDEGSLLPNSILAGSIFPDSISGSSCLIAAGSAFGSGGMTTAAIFCDSRLGGSAFTAAAGGSGGITTAGIFADSRFGGAGGLVSIFSAFGAGGAARLPLVGIAGAAVG